MSIEFGNSASIKRFAMIQATPENSVWDIFRVLILNGLLKIHWEGF